jgi:hypothetical protein
MKGNNLNKKLNNLIGNFLFIPFVYIQLKYNSYYQKKINRNDKDFFLFIK